MFGFFFIRQDPSPQPTRHPPHPVPDIFGEWGNDLRLMHMEYENKFKSQLRFKAILSKV